MLLYNINTTLLEEAMQLIGDQLRFLRKLFAKEEDEENKSDVFRVGGKTRDI